ncbi:MAG: hypothetical protein D6694_13285 [Gammaproteobacteria bacterium]|nr:MAG: hypothetical protein D6694_13285 [Gammaproteobacteria bacterium]
MKSFLLLLLKCTTVLSVTIVLSLCLVSCGNGLPVDENGKFALKIKSTTLRIPGEYIIVPFLAVDKETKKVDVSKLRTLKIPFEELGLRPTGEKDDVFVDITDYSLDSFIWLRNKIKDAWLGRGDYKGGKIETDEKSGLVFVYPNPEASEPVMIFTRPPQAGNDGTLYWFGKYHPAVQICEIGVFFHELYLEVWIPFTDRHQLLKAKRRFLKLLGSWADV